ncbi:hypothetical protein V6N13_088159 [Hibiscus sabdariffa]
MTTRSLFQSKPHAVDGGSYVSLGHRPPYLGEIHTIPKPLGLTDTGMDSNINYRLKVSLPDSPRSMACLIIEKRLVVFKIPIEQTYN